MLTKTRMWQVLVCSTLCMLVSSGAQAASGRGMAIGRAFSYAYNNPMPELGSGPMGSSMYTGGSFNVPIAGGASPGYASAGQSALSDSMRSYRVYTPMAPMSLSTSGGRVATYSGSGGGYSDPVREMASALAQKDKQGFSLNVPPLTSLAPLTPGAYQAAMQRGERAFRQGKYEDALKSFETALSLSKDSAESLLSLAHACFATGDKSYAQGGAYLAKALAKFPDLPLVRVRLKDFFGNADEYKKDLASLEAYTKDNPKEVGAMLLLGYVQYRDGKIDKSLDTLDAAMATSQAKDLSNGITTLLDGISRSGQIVLSQAPPMGQARDYPWAGIRLAMPSGFKPALLTSPNQVAAGIVENEDKSDSHQVTLYAYPLDEGGFTLKAFMDFMGDSMRESPAVKDMSTLAEAEVPFQTGKALVRLFSYNWGSSQNKTFMGWVAFIREPKDGKGTRVAYMLGLATTEAQADKLLPTLAAIAKTIAMIDLASPAPASIDTRGGGVEDRQLQFSIVQPWGWAGQRTDKGYEMGQTDLAAGSAVSPRVQVIVQVIPGTYTPKSFGEEAIQRKAPKGMTLKVLSQGAAKLAGQDGYQFVVSQTPEEGSRGTASLLIGRLICLANSGGTKTVYAIVVNCGGAQADGARKLADNIAAGFKLLQRE